MKVFALAVFFSLLCPLISMAGQGAEIGIKLGGMQSGVYGNSRDASMKSHLGICGGGYCEMSINDDLVFRSEILLVSRSFDRTYIVPFVTGMATFAETDKVTYLEFPLLLKFPFPFRPAFRPSLYVGVVPALRLRAHAEASYVLSGDQIIPNGSFSAGISNSNRFDIGPLVGVDASFQIRSRAYLHADIRFSFGLQKMFKDDKNFNSPEDSGAPVVDLRNGNGLDLKNAGVSFTLGLGWR